MLSLIKNVKKAFIHSLRILKWKYELVVVIVIDIKIQKIIYEFPEEKCKIYKPF